MFIKVHMPQGCTFLNFLTMNPHGQCVGQELEPPQHPSVALGFLLAPITSFFDL